MSASLRRVTTAMIVAAAMTLSLATISIADHGACVAVSSGFNEGGHDSSDPTITCSANTDSRAIAVGAYSNATAWTDSFARSKSDGDNLSDNANAELSSTAIVRNGGTATARNNSSATATNGDGNRVTFAEAVDHSIAEADGTGSIAYARQGSTAIATNGGCAEAWAGTTAVADQPGITVVTGRLTPVWCPSS